MPQTPILITDLNNFMKNYPSGIIEWNVNPKLNIGLYDLLSGEINQTAFQAGEYYEFLIKTKQPYTARGFGENIDLPLPRSTAYEMAKIALKEMIVTAGVSKQARDKATGGTASWGNIVADAIDMMHTDFKTLLAIAALGDGSGKLARIKASTSHANTGATVEGIVYDYTPIGTADNTYLDFGWDNVLMMKPNMLVDIYRGSALQVEKALVVSVTPGLRNNGAAADGSFTLYTVGDYTPTDNDVIYLHGCYATGLPMGLTGLVTDNSIFGAGTTTFQTLTRASYASLLSPCYDATDFAAGAAGTPDVWDLSVITDAITQTFNNTGKTVDALLVNASLALCMSRLNKSNDMIVSVASQSAGYSAPVAGAQIAKTFIGPNGEMIPIKCDPTIPPNVLFGLCTDDLAMYTKGNFDFLREYGEIWEPARDSRKTNYEAPYGGYLQLGAKRCDTSFILMDLKTNL